MDPDAEAQRVQRQIDELNALAMAPGTSEAERISLRNEKVALLNEKVKWKDKGMSTFPDCCCLSALLPWWMFARWSGAPLAWRGSLHT